MYRYVSEQEQIAMDFYKNKTKSVKEIRKEFKISKRRFYKLINQLELVRQEGKGSLFTQEQELEICNLYQSIKSTSKLGEQFNCDANTIRNILKRHGFDLNKRGNSFKTFTSEQINDMSKRWQLNESQESIAKIYNTSQGKVSAILRRLGQVKDDAKPRKERHGNWNGGKSIRPDGYVSILLDRNDPLFSMSTFSGYVLEHRYVMAKSLGRPLTDLETVHHINGIKTDNRIENLQLHKGRHGNGVCLKCRNCGSQDIVEVNI